MNTADIHHDLTHVASLLQYDVITHTLLQEQADHGEIVERNLDHGEVNYTALTYKLTVSSTDAHILFTPAHGLQTKFCFSLDDADAFSEVLSFAYNHLYHCRQNEKNHDIYFS